MDTGETTMKKLIAAAVLIPGLALTALTASAHSGLDRIDARLERQQARIEQGVSSGELTRKETKYLKREQRRLHKKVRKFSRDGRLSSKERRKLTAGLDRASDNIYSFKHNESSRPRARDNRRHSKHKAYWRDRDNHSWSYELGLWPKYSQR
jgi:septal ring factor EnvC (AmiA/AmiB activator)